MWSSRHLVVLQDYFRIVYKWRKQHQFQNNIQISVNTCVSKERLFCLFHSYPSFYSNVHLLEPRCCTLFQGLFKFAQKADADFCAAKHSNVQPNPSVLQAGGEGVWMCSVVRNNIKLKSSKPAGGEQQEPHTGLQQRNQEWLMFKWTRRDSFSSNVCENQRIRVWRRTRRR